MGTRLDKLHTMAVVPPKATEAYVYNPNPPKLPLYKYVVAGGGAGICEILVMYPLDVVKTRMQLTVTSEALLRVGCLASLLRLCVRAGRVRLCVGLRLRLRLRFRSGRGSLRLRSCSRRT